MSLFLHKFKPASHSCSIDKNMASHSSNQFLYWMSVSQGKKNKEKTHQILEKHKGSKGSQTLNELNELYLTHHG